jgi:hypothetical protein
MLNARAEEYRRKASACRKEAAWASDENKAAWLDLAARWEQAAYGEDEHRRLALRVGRSSVGSAGGSASPTLPAAP